MEHRCNSTGLIFCRFAIFYRIFLAILPIFDAYFVRQPACPTFLAIIPSTLYATCSAHFHCGIVIYSFLCQSAAMFRIAARRSTIPDHKMIFGNFICTSVRSSAFRKSIYQSIILQPFLPTDLPPALLRKSVAFLLGLVRFMRRWLIKQPKPTKKNMFSESRVQLNLLFCTIYTISQFLLHFRY